MNIYLQTFGCKMNQFESQAIIEILKNNNFNVVNKFEEADIVIINSCTVTEKAQQKNIMFMKKAKKLGKIVIITGCYATVDYEEIEEMKYADIILDNNSKFKIPEILIKKFNIDKNVNSYEKGDFPDVYYFDTTRAFVKIQDGCNRYCSYCIVPYARGNSRSNNPDLILKTVRDLVGLNYKEIVLTGINISDYNYKDYKLIDLLNDIISITGDFRIRLSSLQPDKFDLKILDFLNNDKFANHFHLSLQSGSSSVLKRMNRHYTPEQYYSIVKIVRDIDKTCGITTDIIVGFPDETEDEFRETMEFIEKIEFTRIHIFPYSKRKGTLAVKFNDLPFDIKKNRLKVLENISLMAAKNFIRKNILGKKFKVLIEDLDRNVWSGYTSNYLRINSIKEELKHNEFFLLTASDLVVKKNVIELIDN